MHVPSTGPSESEICRRRLSRIGSRDEARPFFRPRRQSRCVKRRWTRSGWWTWWRRQWRWRRWWRRWRRRWQPRCTWHWTNRAGDARRRPWGVAGAQVGQGKAVQPRQEEGEEREEGEKEREDARWCRRGTVEKGQAGGQAREEAPPREGRRAWQRQGEREERKTAEAKRAGRAERARRRKRVTRAMGARPSGRQRRRRSTRACRPTSTRSRTLRAA